MFIEEENAKRKPNCIYDSSFVQNYYISHKKIIFKNYLVFKLPWVFALNPSACNIIPPKYFHDITSSFDINIYCSEKI